MVVGSVLALVPWGFAAEPAQATHAQPVGRTPPVVFRTAATNEPASGGVLVPEEVRRGHDLARVYCAACHLFPDPELLDKRTWLNGALMKMAPMLGVARLNLASRPEGELLRGAGVFPEQPLISAEEWRAIVGYYQRMAPEVALPQTNSVVVSPSLPGFRVRSLEYEGAGPATTLVRVDPKQRRLFVGNAAAKSLDLLDAAGRLERRVMLDSAPSSIAWGRAWDLRQPHRKRVPIGSPFRAGGGASRDGRRGDSSDGVGSVASAHPCWGWGPEPGWFGGFGGVGVWQSFGEIRVV